MPLTPPPSACSMTTPSFPLCPPSITHLSVAVPVAKSAPQSALPVAKISTSTSSRSTSIRTPRHSRSSPSQMTSSLLRDMLMLARKSSRGFRPSASLRRLFPTVAEANITITSIWWRASLAPRHPARAESRDRGSVVRIASSSPRAP